MLKTADQEAGLVQALCRRAWRAARVSAPPGGGPDDLPYTRLMSSMSLWARDGGCKLQQQQLPPAVAGTAPTCVHCRPLLACSWRRRRCRWASGGTRTWGGCRRCGTCCRQGRGQAGGAGGYGRRSCSRRERTVQCRPRPGQAGHLLFASLFGRPSPAAARAPTPTHI